MRFLLVLLTGIVMLSSCVPNKKLQLMQKDDVNVKGLLKDTVIRSYSLDTFQYKVQPNDVLYVQFKSLTNKDFDFFNQSSGPQQGISVAAIGGGGQLFGELVDENGEIPLPVVGSVRVSGLTIFEIEDKLTGIAEQYIESPIVKVRLMNYRITVLGEVNQEGTVTLNNNRVSMIEAIGEAGGLGELADRSNVKLIRQKGGQTEVIYINLLEEDFFNSPYYYVYQNDVLIVPPLKQRPFRRYFGQNLSLIVSTISLLLLAFNLSR